MKKTYLQYIDARARYVAYHLVLVVKVAAEHLRALVHRVLNLDGDATARLRLFDRVHRAMVDLQRGATI